MCPFYGDQSSAGVVAPTTPHINTSACAVVSTISGAVGMAAATLFCDSPRDPRDECNDEWVKCYLEVGKLGMRGEELEFFIMECHYCQMQCIAAAKSGALDPWPSSRRCNYNGWPKNHPHYPLNE